MPTTELEFGELMHCVHCHATMGRVVKIQGVEMLRVGSITCRAIHGVCSQCGAEYHWSMGDVMISRLIARVLANRDKISS